MPLSVFNFSSDPKDILKSVIGKVWLRPLFLTKECASSYFVSIQFHFWFSALKAAMFGLQIGGG